MSKFCLNHKVFTSTESTENGEVSAQTTFKYKQVENQIEANYAGGDIKSGHLMGVMTSENTFSMFYHHLNQSNEMRVGRCDTMVDLNSHHKIVLIEKWQWLNGDCSAGHSILVEV